MPHITVEYSNNIAANLDKSALLKTLHQGVVDQGVDVSKIKSRAMKLSDYIVTDGASDNSMIHVNILLLEGRGEEFANALGQALSDKLKTFITDSNIQNCADSLEVREMSANLYFK